MAIPVGSVTQATQYAVSSTVRSAGQLFVFDPIYNVAVVVNSGSQTVQAKSLTGSDALATVPGQSPGVVVPLVNGQIYLYSLGHGTALSVTPGTYGTGGNPAFETSAPFFPGSPDASVTLTKAVTTLLMSGGTGNLLAKVSGSTVATLSPGVPATVSLPIGTVLTLSSTLLRGGPASVIGY